MTAVPVADALADSAVALGIRDTGDAIATEIEKLLADPLARFMAHPNWPSAASPAGLPFEFSLAIGADGTPSIRYAIDFTDHSQGLAGNWGRYLQHAVEITDSPEASSEVWGLISKHLDGMPPLFRTRVMHGAGYAPNGRRRATLYFRARWLTTAQLRRRFPDHLRALDETLRLHGGPYPSHLEAMGYDFADGRLVRTKLYQPLRLTEETTKLSQAAGSHPDLDMAADVYEALLPTHRGSLGSESLLLQLTPHGGTCRAKLLFMCSAWGWERSEHLGRLMAYLGANLGAPLWALDVLLEVFARYQIRLAPTVVGIGPGPSHPSLSFYFAPSITEAAAPPGSAGKDVLPRTTTNGARPARDGALLETVEEMIQGARGFLLSAQAPEGSWIDFDLGEPESGPLGGAAEEWATAYIALILAADPPARRRLGASAESLQRRLRPGVGWGWNQDSDADAESTALSLLAMRRLGASMPENALELLLRYRLSQGGYGAYPGWDWDHEQGAGAPEVTAAVALAALGLAGGSDVVAGAVANLISQQREDGGWNAFWWRNDLFATHRALQALVAVVEQESTPTGALSAAVLATVAGAVEAGRDSILATALHDDPYALGLWLGSWLGAQGSPGWPSVERIVRHLQRQQRSDGRWLAVPMKRIARTMLVRPWARADSGRLYLDGHCLITSATVMEGLLALRKALEPPGDAGSEPSPSKARLSVVASG